MNPQADFDVVVVGELNADLILKGDVTPQYGQVEKLIDDATLTIGSSSAIFACGAARLGLRVAFIGKVGDDHFGRYMRDELEKRRIDTQGIITDNSLKTGLTVILSRGNDRAILTYLGSIAALHFSDIDFSIIRRARHLHLGSYYLLDVLRPDTPALFKSAHESGLTVSIDTNYDPTEKWEGGLAQALAHTDVFLPNEGELCAIARTSNMDEALANLSRSVPLLVVKRGAEGAVARQNLITTSAASIPVTVVDTTGAGDSFDAGFIYSYLQGWETAKSLRFAAICGALSTRAAGGTAAQATLEEALALL